MDIYDELLKAGVKLDSHESDLYALKTPESTIIVEKYRETKLIRTFQNQVDNLLWYDIPFAYKPWWEAKRRA